MKICVLTAVWGAIVVIAGCKREQRVFDPGSSGAQVANGVALNDIHPGGPMPPPMASKYEGSAYAVGEGKRLFAAYNCSGCHQHGGGGIGPALMDAEWIYGSRPEQIYSTIVQGRPNGMPSFGGKIPDYQVWELAAYVRSMSGLVSKNAAPNRDDHMHLGPPENSRQAQLPKEV